MDGPGPRVARRRRVGAAGDRAEVQKAVVVGLVGADLAEPAHGIAVELELVDRLAGADPAQLGRAVRGQQDQRDRRPRRPRPRPGGGCAAAEPDVHSDRRRRRRSRAQTRARRSRRCARPGPPAPRSPAAATAPAPAASSASRGRRRPADPAAGQLLDHGRGEGGVGVGRIHLQRTVDHASRRRRKGFFVDLDAQPGPVGDAQRAAVEDSAGPDALREQALGREAVGERRRDRRAPAAPARCGRPPRSRSVPPGRSRGRRGSTAATSSAAAMPPTLASFTVAGCRRPAPRALPRVSSRASRSRRPRSGSRRAHAELRHLLEAGDRLLGELDRVAPQSPAAARRLRSMVQAPLASIADPRLGPERAPDGGDLRHVPGQPDLELEGGEALRPPSRSASCRQRRRVGRRRASRCRARGPRCRRRAAARRVSPPALAGEVVQGDVDRRQRRGRRAAAAAARESPTRSGPGRARRRAAPASRRCSTSAHAGRVESGAAAQRQRRRLAQARPAASPWIADERAARARSERALRGHVGLPKGERVRDHLESSRSTRRLRYPGSEGGEQQPHRVQRG